MTKQCSGKLLRDLFLGNTAVVEIKPFIRSIILLANRLPYYFQITVYSTQLSKTGP